ncbi:MAG: hypothetical protein JWM04_1356, partial [Verrucomicrobiales bacterium]|nr:hypothetical protein [Verrucomicrobiales bacterium]
MRIDSKLLLTGITLAFSSLLHADFQPVAVSGFTQDIVVEKNATPGIFPATTASLDSGNANTGSSYYERGYNVDASDTGLPAP